VGVTGTGVTITFPVGANDAQVLSASDISGNSAFDNAGFGPFTSVSGGSALLSQVVIFGSPVGLTNTYDCYLGTFQFTAGLQAGWVTPITASIPIELHSNDNIAATDPPTVLSTIVDGHATITVTGGITSVPEPDTRIPVVIVSILVAFRLRRGGVAPAVS